MKTAESKPVDYRAVMRKVERVVNAIEESDEIDAMVHTVAERIIDQLRDDLGIFGGRVYKRQFNGYVLKSTFGEAVRPSDGVRIDPSYPPIRILLEKGLVYMERDDARLDRQLEDRLAVHEFAAIEVGDGQYLLAFNVAPGHDRDDILFSLGVLRYSINQKIRRERMEDVFRQARKIQSSILPRQVPRFHDFDICGQTESMETVGGDFYDYIPVTDKILGLAIADVSGHGLPAALQVRDIYTGLRMGMARDFKIVRTVERLNNIIHQSTLTSRFVSMFYGELERDGTFIYVNAGHPPPFHLAADGEVTYLDEGGVVLGPVADATYDRGFVKLGSGDLLVLYTDGIVETTCDPTGRAPEYGLERLLQVCRTTQRSSARKIMEAIFEDVAGFCEGGSPVSDDRTVVVVKRT